MDISGVSIPAIPDMQPQTPRDAEMTTAVKEAAKSEPENNDANAEDARSESNQRRESTSGLGQLVDEQV